MKEFIEKLIGRLEEAMERYEDVSFFEMNTNGHTLDFEYSNGKKDGVNESIEIANELAEEYKLFGNSEQVNLSENLTGWIPCSERLPEVFDNVIICTKEGGRAIGHRCPNQAFGRYYDLHSMPIDNVIAWMPLPAPYQIV